jgi:hypothetical protein
MNDPIVEAIHRSRAEILLRFNGDLRSYVDDVIRRQGADGRALFCGKPRRPDDWQKPAAPEPEKRAG